MAFHTRYHQQDTDELSTFHRLVFIHPLDKALLCSVPRFIVLRYKRREGGENHMAKDLDGAFRWVRLLFSELVAVGIAHW